MARNQKSWGLKFVLASIVLLFCLAVTTVEGRSVPFLAQLTPENTGRTNSKNNDYVGTALAYLANRGRSYRAAILVAVNIDPKEVSNVQLYNVADEELIDGTKFTYIDEGYFALDTTIDAEINANINLENVAVHIYFDSIGDNRPGLSGVLLNNPNTYLVSLRADQEVTEPSGTKKNVGFATIITTQNADGTYTLSASVNHDLDQNVQSIAIHAPAASNTESDLVIDIPILSQGGKVVDASVSNAVVQYLYSHLAYVQIKTKRNPTGALRGQVIPTTNARIFTPTFVNTATQGDITFLPDGSTLLGDVGLGLRRGGARNYTDDRLDTRVVEFAYNVSSSTFDNDFRFRLPVTLKNKYSVRGAYFVLSAAADATEAGKYAFGIVNLATGETETLSTIAATGRRAFTTYAVTVGVSQFGDYLAPGGLFFNIQGAGLTSELFVDILGVIYYVNNAYANNIVKSIFYSGSNLHD